jgi:hypothetical protein
MDLLPNLSCTIKALVSCSFLRVGLHAYAGVVLLYGQHSYHTFASSMTNMSINSGRRTPRIGNLLPSITLGAPIFRIFTPKNLDSSPLIRARNSRRISTSYKKRLGTVYLLLSAVSRRRSATNMVHNKLPTAEAFMQQWMEAPCVPRLKIPFVVVYFPSR